MVTGAQGHRPSHPEFICAGAQKAGTKWFYDQARKHPRIWMPPVKELRYFSSPEELPRRAQAQLQRKLARSPDGQLKGDRDLQFLQQASRAAGGSLDEYVRLFEPAGERVTGDISPAYAPLGEPVISELATRLPDCRFLFFVRDPIARLWSQVNMRMRDGRAPKDVLSNLAVFERFIAQPPLKKFSFQAADIRRWRNVIGPERFRVFMMEDLVSDPAAYRRAVFAHIGLDGDDCRIAAGFNEKESNEKAAMPETYRACLAEYFRAEYEVLEAETRDCRLTRATPAH